MTEFPPESLIYHWPSHWVNVINIDEASNLIDEEASMSPQFYLILHLVGVIVLFYALGGLALHVVNGGTREFPKRRWMMIIHGIGMMLVFIPGFGLLAKLEITWPWPFWVWGKLVAWLCLGLITRVILKKTEWANILFFVVLALGAWAVLLVELKP